MKLKLILIIAMALTLGIGAAFADLSNQSVSGGTTYIFQAPTTAGGGDTTLTFTPSTNVTVKITSTTTTYGGTSHHLNGDRCFGVASDATNIFWSNATGCESGATSVVDAPASAGGFTSWKSL